MSKRSVYFNGGFVPESNARISIFDSSLMFGDMAFEMTRTFNHKPFRLRAHLERLYASLRLLEIDCGLTINQMESITIETLDLNTSTEARDVDWQIMHNISRGPLEPYRTVFPEGLRPTICINCWPLITHLGDFFPTYKMGVHLAIPSQQTIPAQLMDAKAKTRSRMHYQLAQLQAKRMGESIWPLMLDPDGFLSEGPGWNIFLVRNKIVYTPEGRNILLGISRDTTIQLTRKLGLSVKETNIGRYEALQADELFCTSTPYCLVHARKFENQTVGDGIPGPVFLKLMKAWKSHVGLDFVSQARTYSKRLPLWEAATAD